MKSDFESLYLIPQDVYQDLCNKEEGNTRHRLNQLNRDLEPNHASSKAEKSKVSGIGQEKNGAPTEKKEKKDANADGPASVKLLSQRKLRQTKKKERKETIKEKEGSRSLYVEKKKPVKSSRRQIPNLPQLCTILYGKNNAGKN